MSVCVSQRVIFKVPSQPHTAIISFIQAGGSDEGLVRTNAHPYAVDGEIGRFTFLTHTGIDATGQAWNTATHVFAALGPREWYRTTAVQELLLQTATYMPYRPAVALLKGRRRDRRAGRRTGRYRDARCFG